MLTSQKMWLFLTLLIMICINSMVSEVITVDRLHVCLHGILVEASY